MQMQSQNNEANDVFDAFGGSSDQHNDFATNNQTQASTFQGGFSTFQQPQGNDDDYTPEEIARMQQVENEK